MKFKVGDVVEVKEWGELIASYGMDCHNNLMMDSAIFLFPMSKYCGAMFKVSRVMKDGYILSTLGRGGKLLAHKGCPFHFDEDALRYPLDDGEDEECSVSRFEVGDRVRVRTWNDLKENFLIDMDGDLLTGKTYFVKEMKKYCGNVYQIDGVKDDHMYTLSLLDGTGVIMSNVGIETLFDESVLEPAANDEKNTLSHEEALTVLKRLKESAEHIKQYGGLNPDVAKMCAGVEISDMIDTLLDLNLD